MSIAFHNKGKSVIKIGDVVILPDTSYNFEGDAFKEICSNPMDIESTSLLMHNMAAAQEKNKKKELTKEEKWPFEATSLTTHGTRNRAASCPRVLTAWCALIVAFARLSPVPV